MSSVVTSHSHWLSDCLCDLMASPHISMPPHGGMLMGPGPVDLFTVRFDQYFMPGAHGTICGHAVDRDGIKDCLLNLQKRWNTEEVKVMQEAAPHGFPLSRNVVRRPRLCTHTTVLTYWEKLSTEVEFTPPGNHLPEIVTAEASFV